MREQKEKVIIVFTVYKDILKKSEQASLIQLRKVLNKYPICCIGPKRLENVLRTYGEYKVFQDKYFVNISSYSQLMLSAFFYETFKEYEYILIYQLDAFVFDDRLLYFCNLGYDYIGAPVPYAMWRHSRTMVGNGGLSLRRVSACIEVTKNKEKIIEISGQSQDFNDYEDKFFGYCGANESIDFRIPNVKEALDFSVEADVSGAYKKIQQGVITPFGCHGWTKLYFFGFWKLYLKKHIKPELLLAVEQEILGKSALLTSNDFKSECILIYLMERIMRKPAKQYKTITGKILPCDTVVLWGCGKIGKRIVPFIKYLGIIILAFYDRSAETIREYNGISIKRPCEKINGKLPFVIITVNDARKEIEEELISKGYIYGESFIYYGDLVKALSHRYRI